MTLDSVPLTAVLKYLEDNCLTGYANMIPATDGIVSLAEAFRVADQEEWCEAFDRAVHMLTGAECVERTNGDRFWYKDGKLHRDDGPAMEYADGDRCWYKNGLLHRDDGPAIEHADGSRSWYQHGMCLRTERTPS